MKPEFGRALEALLGTAAEAIEVSDAETVQRILADLEREQIGPAILRMSERTRRDQPASDLPPGLAPAIAILENPDASHPALALLGACYVADDLEGFLRFWRDRPDFDFLTVATRKGEMVDRRGLVAGGHSSSKQQANSLVRREIELRESGRALVEEQKLHEGQKSRIDSISAAGVI